MNDYELKYTVLKMSRTNYVIYRNSYNFGQIRMPKHTEEHVDDKILRLDKHVYVFKTVLISVELKYESCYL